MSKLNTFQLIVLGAFGLLAIAGFIAFSTFQATRSASIGSVTVWGTIDSRIVNDTIEDLRESYRDLESITYVEKSESTYIQQLVEALASGVGPDVFMLSADQTLSQSDRIIVIPYDTYSERTFKDTFIELGELFLVNDGIQAFPLTVDPMIMYWNRDIFSRSGVAQPPKFWDELITLAPAIVERTEAGQITRSLVAFGEYQNVTHAKEILSTLMFQAGTPITGRNSRGKLIQMLSGAFDGVSNPTEAALQFYTEFANPVQVAYSWNRSLPASKQAFLAGDLAIYFGFASELTELQALNPNLNFDIAPIPQSRDSKNIATFGEITGLAISKQARNPSGGFAAIQLMTSPEFTARLSGVTGLPPVRRDVLSQRPSDAYRSLTFDAALLSRGWLDPDPRASGFIFQEMIESVTSGRERINDAVRNADLQLGTLFD